MLQPNARSLYTAALTPPPGFVLDQAIATTFSLDPTTLLTLPLHLALLGQQRGQDPLTDGIAILEALRRITQKLTVYAQRGRLQAPRQHHLLYGLLESVVVEVRAPRGGAFHPKLWLLRFVDVDDPNAVMLRLLVLSRNLTADRSWDLVLQLEGVPGGRYVGINRELGELFAALPDLAVESVPDERRRQAAALGEELRKTPFEPPTGWTLDNLHVLGVKNRRLPRPDWMNQLAVISPFCHPDALRWLCKVVGERVLLVSRPETLTELPAESRELFRSCKVLDEAAETEDGEAIEDEIDREDRSVDDHGLHAKVIAWRNGWETTLLVGSANATRAALLDARNVEVMAQLHYNPRTRLDEDLAGTEGLHDVLVDFEPPDEIDPRDPALVAAEQLIEQSRRALEDASLHLRVGAEGEDWRASILSDEDVPLPEQIKVRAWLLTLDEASGTRLSSLKARTAQDLARCGVASITGLVGFEIETRAETATGTEKARARFAMNLPVDGMPPERDAAIDRMVIRNRGGFLRYLLMMLGDIGGLARLAQRTQEGSGAGQWGLVGSGWDDMPLLEELTRAWCRDRERLAAVDRLVRRLRDGGTEDEEILPAEFLAVWDAFTEALELEER